MTKFKITFSQHAEEQIKERNLDKSLVEKTVLKPDQVIEGKKRRKIAQKLYTLKNKKFLLRVIYCERENVIEIVTSYLTTKIEKYWRK